MMGLLRSWVTSANEYGALFPLNNLPYGVFSTSNSGPRCGVAIGDYILDLPAIEAAGLINYGDTFDSPAWNKFMALGEPQWTILRERLIELLKEDSDEQALIKKCLIAQSDAILHMPFHVMEYTDFYAGKMHATNVGSMFRDPENALPPNWLHMPIGYNGRASSIVISGTHIRRPWGQIKEHDDLLPHWAPSKRFDLELEIGAIVGQTSNGPISVDQADANIFGYVLLNDWSARDIQAWEYQPLGPFLGKATATTISPWIITKAALEPFIIEPPKREEELLPHLRDTKPMHYDIDLEILLETEKSAPQVIAQTNYKELYYSAAQQLAHHASSGCSMRVGDLLGSGTISGPEKSNWGSLLELSWGGQKPLKLGEGITRKFIENGDTITLRGAAKGNGYIIGFGDCSGSVLPALENPFSV